MGMTYSANVALVVCMRQLLIILNAMARTGTYWCHSAIA